MTNFLRRWINKLTLQPYRLIVQASLPGGISIHEAAVLMVNTAKRMDVLLEITFNRMTLFVEPDDTPEEIVAAYLEKQKTQGEQ